MPTIDLRAVMAMLVALSTPALATVQIESVIPSPASPQVIGTTIHWTVTGTDTNAGPLTFQFNMARPGGTMSMVKDFNVGINNSGTWTAQPFVWTPTGIEGTYQIEVVAKDFVSGETATSTVSFQVHPLVTGKRPVAVKTANPLVALFSAPACAAGSHMRVSFRESKAKNATVTPWAACTGSTTMTFEIAGMHESSYYEMFSETKTGTKVVDGPMLSFKTGALPTNTPIPQFTVNVPPGSSTDATDYMILEDLTLPGQSVSYPEVATDFAGQILWYYYPPTNEDLFTRPLADGILAIESGPAWNPASQQFQLLRYIDWAGNIVKETNTGAIQQQLLALGATDAQACTAIQRPAPIGAACMDDFDHDFIHTLPNGYNAVIADIEKIYPPGTQGDTSGLPVDIIGNMIIVLDQNWQVTWYFDAFEHDGGAPQLDINRAAVLGETCGVNQLGCPPIFLLGNGIAPLALDWLHGNSLYYWPAPQDGSAKGDIIWSARHQDWVMRVDYQDGTGTGNILWCMGVDGQWTFNNIDNDPWPWFSHQHEAGIESTGDLSLFDNGNTRLTELGVDCVPSDCDSRGMILELDESSMQVTPVLSVDLGVYSTALGSAQLLDNGNYFFMAGFVENTFGYAIEILPTPDTITGTQVFNLGGTVSYRAWRMNSIYTPPGS
jgi:arylsulfate sulfotransferase